jgi:hypothetical protein
MKMILIKHRNFQNLCITCYILDTLRTVVYVGSHHSRPNDVGDADWISGLRSFLHFISIEN